ncbi:MAG: glycosyltransferase, partial [Candidatus Dormibacteraeota bacterium]|nr:glycosyltransferase [Candidatus Dormibacteraeota bacterium]
MRVLVTTTSQAGHFNPLVPFVKALAARGHELLLVVPPALEPTVRGMGHAYRLGAPPSPEVAAIWERVPSLPPGEAAVLINREIFGRLSTVALLPAVEKACSDRRPDLVLREPCEYAGAVVAARTGIRQAQVAISQARIEASALDLVGPALEPHGPDLLETIRQAPYLTRFPASLDPSPFKDTRRFREETESPQDPLPDWWIGGDGPLVYVTLGTVAGELPIAAAAYRAALAAVAPLAVRVLVTVGRSFEVRSLGAIPDNVHVEPWVPQERVLGDAAVVV